MTTQPTHLISATPPQFPCWLRTRGIVKTWIYAINDKRPIHLDNFDAWCAENPNRLEDIPPHPFNERDAALTESASPTAPLGEPGGEVYDDPQRTKYVTPSLSSPQGEANQCAQVKQLVDDYHKTLVMALQGIAPLPNLQGRIETLVANLKHAPASPAPQGADLAAITKTARDLLSMVEDYDGLDWGEDGPPFTPDFDELEEVIAKAEAFLSAPSQPDATQSNSKEI